jgi:hypothetical protein
MIAACAGRFAPESKAWVYTPYLIGRAEQMLPATAWGQDETLVPPYTCGSASLSRGPGRNPGASLYTACLYTWQRLSLSRGPGRNPGASLYTRNRLSLTLSISVSARHGVDAHFEPLFLESNCIL